MNTHKLTTLGFFTALALAVYAIESMIPPLVPIPGIKLGLSNIITLLLLKEYDKKDAALVLIARILLSALLFGQMISLLYSLMGGLFALCAMAAISALLKRTMFPLTGAFGGIFHNMGQLLIAYFITRTVGVLSYAPFLLISGIITGIFTGLIVQFLPSISLLHKK